MLVDLVGWSDTEVFGIGFWLFETEGVDTVTGESVDGPRDKLVYVCVFLGRGPFNIGKSDIGTEEEEEAPCVICWIIGMVAILLDCKGES